jgi:hypothetical protein
MAPHTDVVLRKAKWRAARDQDHFPHQLDARDRFAHRMLNLDAGVHLKEKETLRILIVQIFERAGAARGLSGAGRRYWPNQVTRITQLRTGAQPCARDQLRGSLMGKLTYGSLRAAWRLILAWVPACDLQWSCVAGQVSRALSLYHVSRDTFR